jgi:hypothetical protein
MSTGELAIDADGSTRWAWVDTVWVLAIALLGLGLRLVYVLEYIGHPVGQLPWVDEGAYWSRAQEILGGRWLPGRPFYQDPLFPYALALLMKFAGQTVATLRVVLACLGALTPVVIFLAGRRGLGRSEGVVAGLIAASYRPLIFTDGLLEKEGQAALVASLALMASARASADSTRAKASWMGISGWTWGLLALLRANALLVGPLGASWAVAIGRGRRLALGLAFSGGFALAILPSTIVNAMVGRSPELILTTYQSGANFYIGNGPGATGTYWAPEFVEANPAREADDFEAEAWRRSGQPLSPARVSTFWLLEGLRQWRQAPAESIRLLFKKLGLLFHDYEVPDNQDLKFVGIIAPRLSWGILSFGWLAPSAALGLARRDRSSFWWLLATSTLIGLSSTAAFFVVARYRIPWTPGLALLAGAGLVDLARRVKSHEWASIAWRLALIALPVAAMAWRPIPDPVPDRWGHIEIMLAVAELGEAHLEAAIDAFDDARAVAPGAAIRVGEITAAGPVHDRLASLIQARADAGGGKANVPQLQLARWLRQLPEGRLESRTLLDRALAEDSESREALRESGAWFLGDLEDPEARLRASRELSLACREPGVDPSATILLSLLSGNIRYLSDADESRKSPFFLRLRLIRAILRDNPLQKNLR